MLYLYGELKQSRRMATAIVKARSAASACHHRPAAECGEAVYQALAREEGTGAGVFQALRIEVNDEISVLKRMLQQALEVLEARRTTGDYHLPLARRPPGEKLHEERQH